MKRRKIFAALDKMTSGMQRTNRKMIRLKNSLEEVKEQIDRIGEKKR